MELEILPKEPVPYEKSYKGKGLIEKQKREYNGHFCDCGCP